MKAKKIGAAALKLAFLPFVVVASGLLGAVLFTLLYIDNVVSEAKEEEPRDYDW